MVKVQSSSIGTRASRDGHEFHEAWAARMALSILLPTNGLAGISIEGLHPADEKDAKDETVEIADVVLYYGKQSSFAGANKVKIIQCKYSISREKHLFRASDAKKTIRKFTSAYLDHQKRYGVKNVGEKLSFEIVSNRPIFDAFSQAIAGIAEKKILRGEIKDQADQFISASGLKGKLLSEFAGKFQLTGLVGSLDQNKRQLSRTIISWSAADDAQSRARLGSLRQLVRDKAGSAGLNKNVIGVVDVLDALDISELDDLLPSPASLPVVGKVVEREQLPSAIALFPNIEKPLLIHGAGGIGKTVFMESLKESLSLNYEVLLFDCFGGGSYRAPDDSRHLPQRGMVHIINTLAGRGLCDPLLPSNASVDSLVKTFRRRLSQCVHTLATVDKDRQVILFIDAIDNAADHANDRNESSFPTLLLESFHHIGVIPGVKLVVSCRSYRIKKATKGIPCHNFELKPFGIAETTAYLQQRIPGVTQTEIHVAQARSDGNARILEHLATSDRGLLDTSEIAKTIWLDDLLFDRIEKALMMAKTRGYSEKDIAAFLAGLSVLPPPVPLAEYAGAHGMELGTIESFAADLAPLLEKTKHGLIFRDEPTETLIREKFGADAKALKRVATNLIRQQDTSIYAARALPSLLQKLGDGKSLFELAFDSRFPQSITSMVGQRKVRYSRLKAAVLWAAEKSDYNKLVHLLVELSTIASIDQRGAKYILDYPDLVTAAQDVDANRRLFETRTEWPGTRHTRLSIANILAEEFNDGYRHAHSGVEWIHHYFEQDQENRMRNEGQPVRLDIASIPLCLIAQNRPEDAISFMKNWKPWFGYEVGDHLFRFLKQLESTFPSAKTNTDRFLENLSDEISLITSALSFYELDQEQVTKLIKKLAQVCKSGEQVEIDDGYRQESNHRIQEGLLRASIIASSLGLKTEARRIANFVQIKRPGIWSFQDHFLDNRVPLFLIHKALNCVLNSSKITEWEIFPTELITAISKKKFQSLLTKGEFITELKKHLDTLVRRGQEHEKEALKDKRASLTYKEKQAIDDFLDNRLQSLLNATKALSDFFSKAGSKDKQFLAFLDIWEELTRKGEHHVHRGVINFFHSLGKDLSEFLLWVCPSLKVDSVEKFLVQLHRRQGGVGISTIIRIISILSVRSHLHQLAGQEAVTARSIIESETDVDLRATYFGELGRAILPASRVEAVAYFKIGLEQLDAIGSGDYHYTNELLHFASSLKDSRLTEENLHTLTNICELNMPQEEEKFPWYEFANGLTTVSGFRTLAKLSRWDDRSKVALNYTLLPYLTALIKNGMIGPEDAIALNRLANPAELYVCNTATFAQALEEKNYLRNPRVLNELINQFESNNPGVSSGETLKVLVNIAQKVLGSTSSRVSYLSAAQIHHEKLRDELNENMNYRGRSSQNYSKLAIRSKRLNKSKMKKLIDKSKQNDAGYLEKIIQDLKDSHEIYEIRQPFFEALRSNVVFSNRSQYIKTLADLENLELFFKISELKACKSAWEKSSTGLQSIYEGIGVSLLELHADEFVSFDQLSLGTLQELSDLTGIHRSVLSVELTKIFASSETLSPASAWLGLAAIICEKAKKGEGKAALIRLLNSSSAKLTSSVMDGEWKMGLYPRNEITEVASGLIWRMLGSPHASDRWQAAHSIRAFAKFGRWNIIDAVVAKFYSKKAHPFQAPELPFYYMHARLWLLITLSRIAIDFPNKIAQYHKLLLRVVQDTQSPHVLMRHFASQTILICAKMKSIKLTKTTLNKIQSTNASQFPRQKQDPARNLFHINNSDRPKSVPEPKGSFHLDYDFYKYHVTELSTVFGFPKWLVADMISEVVRTFDTKVGSMHETGGRQVRDRDAYGMTSKYHTYAQQLGWHSFFIVAGKLLAKFPITGSSYNDEPWEDFLNGWLLTRKDGLWLSDGLDNPPLTTKVNLLEKGKKHLVITGNQKKLEALVSIDSKLTDEIVVCGDWHSPDQIDVSISSALVETSKVKSLAKKLIAEDPFSAWLPVYDHEEEGEERWRHSNKEADGYNPWIFRPSLESKLDDDDPLGSIRSVCHPRIAHKVAQKLSLKCIDVAGKTWKGSSINSVATALAWGPSGRYDEDSSRSGVSLVCTKELLGEVLTKLNLELLILIKLQRYEKNYDEHGKFSHTIAVLHINKKLNVDFYAGVVNQIQNSMF